MVPALLGVWLLGIAVSTFRFLGEGASAECQQRQQWKMVFETDVAISDYNRTFFAPSFMDCVVPCLHLTKCRSFAYNKQSATCWLYNHVVEYSTNGSAASATRYFWLLSPRCPSELGYTMQNGICFKFYANLATWLGARKICRTDGAHLMTADSEDVLEMLNGTITSSPWVGATAEDGNWDWRWADGSVLANDSALWLPGQPNGTPEPAHYVQLGNDFFRFYDVPASSRCSVLCQVPVL